MDNKYNDYQASKPDMLTDKRGRTVRYLRLSVTETCNLRCSYCMPDGPVKKFDHSYYLSWEELRRSIKIFTSLGVNKVRLTGGEPFIRKGFVDFLKSVTKTEEYSNIYITSNGTELYKCANDLKEAGIKGINLSIDAVDRGLYKKITGRDRLDSVMKSLSELIRLNIPVKINAVVMKGINDRHIPALARLAEKSTLDIRFIEMMPFSGKDKWIAPEPDSNEIFNILASHFRSRLHYIGLQKNTEIFTIDGFKGRIGIIPAYSRSFCKSCDRIRIGASGEMKHCLYGSPIMNLRDMLRSGLSDEEIRLEIINSMKNKYSDGFAAFENKNEFVYKCMSSIGG